eukprot:223709_1
MSGKMYGWGNNAFGQLGCGDNNNKSTPYLLTSLSTYRPVNICVGSGHSLVLMDDGHVWSFGANEDGQLGHGDTSNINTPKLIESLKPYKIRHISCGNHHCIAISDDNNVFSWGDNGDSQCGLGKDKHGQKIKTPTIIDI